MSTTKKQRNLHPLPNGNRCSEISVTPANWNGKGATTKQSWKIYYRFYDPTHTDKEGKALPYYVSIRSGINEIKDLQERREVVKAIITEEWYKLRQQGFNPFTNTFIIPIEIEYEIEPATGFISALRKALEKLTIVKDTKDDIRYCIDGIDKAAKQLRLDKHPIYDISRRHLKMILQHCEKINEKWSAYRHNVYRSYLMMLFTELVELEAVGANPVRDIKKKKTFKKLRTVLTDWQRKQIDEHLKDKAPRFHKYVHLFFHSGGRGKELMQVRKCDIDLTRQVYKTVIRKGRSYREVERTIKDIAVEYWRFFMKDAKPTDYIFGAGNKHKEGFIPAAKPMHADTPGRWWNRLVKASKEAGGLGIDVDLYSLKHLNSSETVDQAGDEAAAKQMGHLDTNMLKTVYDVKRMDREHEKLKKVNNPFAAHG